MTLQGGGLFHISMCAVLGVSAHGRTQEKLAITNAPTTVAPTTVAPTTVAYAAAPAPMVGVVNGKPAPPKQIDPIL